MGSAQETLRNIFDLVFTLETNNTLSVDGLDYDDKHCVHINKPQKELYAIQLCTSSNLPTFLSDTKIRQLFETYRKKDNGYVITAYFKDKSRQGIYMFSNNKKLLKYIGKYLDVEFLDYAEILNVLFDLMLDNRFKIEDKVQKRGISVDEEIKYESITNSFNKIVKDSVYNNLEKLKVYQSYRFDERGELDNRNDKEEHGKWQDDKYIDLIKLFSLDWHGVIFTYFDFRESATSLHLYKKKRHAWVEGQGKRRDWGDLIDEYKQGKVVLGLANSVAMLRNEDSDEVIGDIGECLSIGYREKKILKRNLIKFSPLIKRDTYWDVPIDREFLYGYIGAVHKENLKKPDIWGYDLMGNFWNYASQQTSPRAFNSNGNALMIGVSGSGKTTSFNGMLAQQIGLDIENNKVSNLDNVYLRIFDIKNSGKKIKNKVAKIRPKDVKSIIADLNNFRYNPLNIKTFKEGDKIVVDQNELSMNILLLSIALESKATKKDSVGLDSSEQLLLAGTITDIFEQENYDAGKIYRLKKLASQEYKKIIALGYENNEDISSIKEKEFDHLKKPTLKNVSKELEKHVNSERNSELKRRMESLIAKLMDIEQMKIFSGYDTIDIRSYIKYLYMDFDQIKKLPEYSPVFLALFSKIYSEDKWSQVELEDQGLPRPIIIYGFEECANIFSQPSFEEYLEKFNNEARSYNIRIIFATQLLSQVPQYIYEQISNIYMLFPEKEKKQDLINKTHKALQYSAKAKWLLEEKTKQYDIAILNEHGMSIFHLPLTANEIEMFGQKTGNQKVA